MWENRRCRTGNIQWSSQKTQLFTKYLSCRFRVKTFAVIESDLNNFSENITDIGITRLSDSLKSLPSLKIIRLEFVEYVILSESDLQFNYSCYNVTKETKESLESSLKDLPSLQKMRIVFKNLWEKSTLFLTYFGSLIPPNILTWIIS